MSKSKDSALLRTIGKDFDAEALALDLGKQGADASACLLPDDVRDKRWKSTDRISIPIEIADKIAAVLLSMPRKQKVGRRSNWPSETWLWAVIALSAGQPVRGLAREMSAATGQSFESVRRRLQEVKGGDMVEEVGAHLEQQLCRLGEKFDMLEAPRAYFASKGYIRAN